MKWFALVGLILLIGLAVAPNINAANETIMEQPLFVGNTLYVGGLGPENYSSIQEAIDNATNGDTIYVYDDSSPYSESLVIDKPLQLLGEQRTTTIISTQNKKIPIAHIIASHVTIQNFTLRKIHASGEYSGIIQINSDYNIIHHNNINSDDFEVDIYIKNCHHNIISDNLITNGAFGLWLDEATHNLIIDNYFAHNFLHSLVVYEESNYNTISDNFFRGGSETDITFIRSHNNNFTRNTLEDGRFILVSSRNNELTKNNFENVYFKTFQSHQNNWDNNYYSDWRGWGPYLIWGQSTFVIGIIFLRPRTFNIFSLDWHPLKNPYRYGDI